MRGLVRKGMEEGAYGLSSGTFYVPGSYSDPDEIVELAKVVAAFGGAYTSHIRDETDYSVGLVAAVAWLQELHAASDFSIGDAFGGVAIVEIEAFPQRSRRAPVRTRWTGIYTELIGPVVAMLNMRSASQTLRDAIEVESLCTILQQGADGHAVPCEHFIFQPSPDVRPPLSWHLRSEDVAAIERSWEQIVEPTFDTTESSLARLLAYMRAHSAPLPGLDEVGDAGAS